MSKRLVSYYSRTGHTQKIAELIAEAVDADVERIIDAKKHEGLFGYLASGREALFKRPGSIQPIRISPSQYDLVILGSPVWAWNLSPPMRKYIMEQQSECEQVAFFCTEGGSGGKRLFKQMEELCGKQPVATLEVTESELESGSYSGKLDGFVQQIKTASKPG